MSEDDSPNQPSEGISTQNLLEELEVTELERECVKTLQDEYPDAKPVSLLRFVRARDCDMVKVKEMYSNYAAWRSEYPATIDLSDAEKELRFGIWHFHGLSRTGVPCVIIKASRFFPSACEKENLTKMVIYAMETIFAANPLEKVICLVDYAGFGYSNVSYETIQWLIGIYSNYYPEVLHAEYVLNAPWLFTQLWNLNRRFIDDRTASKIYILPANREEYLPRLLEHFDSENLERWCGGTSKFAHRFKNATGENPCVGQIGDRKLMDDIENGEGGEDDSVEKVFTMPEMQPDADVTTCNNCPAEFGWFTRKHHCRACGLVFCNKCCGTLVELPPEYKLPGQQRVCIHCSDEFVN